METGNGKYPEEPPRRKMRLQYSRRAGTKESSVGNSTYLSETPKTTNQAADDSALEDLVNSSPSTLAFSISSAISSYHFP
jgi:hypothetical protein